MRADSVEIKVTLSGDQVAQAITRLGLPPDRPAWSIYFCEDVTRGTSVGTPLLDMDVVLRARDKTGDRDDTTVKLRPCRRSQLTDRWLVGDEGDGWEFKLEADWAGSRRVLAASLTAARPDRRIAKVRSGDQPLRKLFTTEQQRFLGDCAQFRVNLNGLTMLPPLTAIRWEPFRTAGIDPELSIRAERWIVKDALDFLELSIVGDVEDAERRQAALEEFLRSQGLVPDAALETKTRRVLEHLVAMVNG